MTTVDEVESKSKRLSRETVGRINSMIASSDRERWTSILESAGG